MKMLAVVSLCVLGLSTAHASNAVPEAPSVVADVAADAQVLSQSDAGNAEPTVVIYQAPGSRSIRASRSILPKSQFQAARAAMGTSSAYHPMSFRSNHGDISAPGQSLPVARIGGQSCLEGAARAGCSGNR